MGGHGKGAGPASEKMKEMVREVEVETEIRAE